MEIDRNNLEALLTSKLSEYKEIPKCDAETRIPAAVLVPFVWRDDEWYLLYTRRTSGVATHQGEISFPGGAFDPDDLSPIKTALRETYEEIGIEENRIKILGALRPYPTITKFCVLPVVGLVDWPVPIKLNPTEVDKLLFYPISWLMERNNWFVSKYTHPSGASRQVIRYQPREGEILWGVTAGITRVILDLL